MIPWRHVGCRLGDLQAHARGDPAARPAYLEFLLEVLREGWEEARGLMEPPPEKSAGLEPERRGAHL